jgi:hypothetical protein
MSVSGVERLARMEVEVSELKKSFEEHKADTKEEFASINKKLDDVLSLRNKGAGVFWVFSLVFGSAGVAGFVQLLHYLGIK